MLPTLCTAFAIVVMVGFGLWQLQRRHWKEALLSEMAAAAAAPMRDLGAGPIRAADAYAKVRVVARCADPKPTERGGRGPDGRSGYSVWLLCEAGGAPLWLDIGWHAHSGPDAVAAAGRIADGLPHAVDGVAARSESPAAAFRLVARQSVPPLLPSAPPDPDEIPNNHLSYAIQWFSFAVIALVLWALYVRDWRRKRLAPGSRGR